MSNCAGSPPSNHRSVCELNPAKILLRSTSNNYVRLSDTRPLFLIADEPNKVKADTFCMCDLKNNVIGLRTEKGDYVTIDLMSGNQAIAQQDYIDSWEKIVINKVGSQALLKGTNNLYIQPANNNNILIASSVEPSNTCLFTIIEL